LIERRVKYHFNGAQNPSVTQWAATAKPGDTLLVNRIVGGEQYDCGLVVAREAKESEDEEPTGTLRQVLHSLAVLENATVTQAERVQAARILAGMDLSLSTSDADERMRTLANPRYQKNVMAKRMGRSVLIALGEPMPESRG